MIRPGAFSAPRSVWQTLQSPFVCGATIARVRPPETTFAVYGVAILAVEKKFPAPFTGNEYALPFASVISTVIEPEAP